MNQVVKKENKNVAISEYINRDNVQKSIANILDDKESKRFKTAMAALVLNDKALQQCEPQSLVNFGLKAFSYGFIPNNDLGLCWAIPRTVYKDGKYVKVATWQMGYFGLYELIMRTGKYKDFHVAEVKEGELKSYDQIRNKMVFDPILDPIERESKETIGFYAMFELHSGAMKETYWTLEKALKHGDRYSESFDLDLYNRWKNGEELKKYTVGKGKWAKDVDENNLVKAPWYQHTISMCKKSIGIYLIKQYGLKDVMLQSAINAEEGLIKDDMTVDRDFSNDIPQEDIDRMTGNIKKSKPKEEKEIKEVKAEVEEEEVKEFVKDEQDPVELFNPTDMKPRDICQYIADHTETKEMLGAFEVKLKSHDVYKNADEDTKNGYNQFLDALDKRL